MTGERDRLRSTFDGAAPLYDEVRPGYPEALFDDVASLSVIPSRGRILEIGCGTGQATVPLARRGYGVLCIEFGETLAVVARRNLAGYPGVEVRVRAFEAYPVAEEAFDLAVSATAFHWLDPAVALPKVARSLKPGGAIALFWNEHVRSERNEGFFEAAQRIYAREAPEIFDDNYGGPPRPDEVPDRAEEIEDSDLFGPTIRRRYGWDQAYDAAEYVRVLDTYSGHRNLDDETRGRLFRGIGRLIDEKFGGRVVKGYQTSLYVARKR